MSDQERSRVLVVDTDPRTAAAVRVALPSGRYEVVEAPDSARALATIREERVDAVLSELVLSDSSGLHLLVEARLRKPMSGSYSHAPSRTSPISTSWIPPANPNG